MPKIIFIIPIMQLIILPFAANFEMRNINLSIVDNDHSVTSMQLVDKVLSSGYFRLTDQSDRYDEALTSVESNESDIILEIPSDFERDLGKEGRADVMIAANAVNGTKGGLGSSYLSSIIQDFNRGERLRLYGIGQGVASINLFNPLSELQDLYGSRHHGILADDYRGSISALNIVSEKEEDDRADKRLARTQVPVPAVEADPFLGDRLCPADGGDPHRLADLRLGAGGEFRGDLFVCRRIFDRFYGFGRRSPPFSSTQQQAMLTAFFFLIIFALLSGLFTPISSMPEWAQKITLANPVRYFVEVMRMVYLKGGFADLRGHFVIVCLFAVFNLLAVISYRKRGSSEINVFFVSRLRIIN